MEDIPVTFDRLFEMLANHRRRYVLYHLNDVENAVVTLDELADQLCTWERDWADQTEQRKGKHRECIRTDLHHVHLPKMADAGIVDYDARSGSVRNRIGDSLFETVEQESDECPHLETLFARVEVGSS